MLAENHVMGYEPTGKPFSPLDFCSKSKFTAAKYTASIFLKIII